MSKPVVLPLEKANSSSCGAKAAACAQLASVAAEAGFQTPAGICLPFGSMELAIEVLRAYSLAFCSETPAY